MNLPAGLPESWQWLALGLLTGMLMALFAVYQPVWVNTFGDVRYLRKP